MKSPEYKKFEEWRKNCRPIWLFAFLALLAYYGKVVALLFLAPIVATVLLTLPAQIGKNAGSSQAAKDLSLFQKGCSRTDAPACVEIVAEGGTTFKGFLVDDSDSHFAIFDGVKKQIWIVKRDGRELRMQWLPSSVEPSAVSH